MLTDECDDLPPELMHYQKHSWRSGTLADTILKVTETRSSDRNKSELATARSSFNKLLKIGMTVHKALRLTDSFERWQAWTVRTMALSLGGGRGEALGPYFKIFSFTISIRVSLTLNTSNS